MIACPHDRSPMQPIHAGHLPAGHACGRCRGLWLPGAVVAARIGATPAVAASAPASRPALRCPDDGATLVAVEHGGVEIDICPDCRGVWLDEGELGKIAPGRTSALDIADATATLADAASTVADTSALLAKGFRGQAGPRAAAGDGASLSDLDAGDMLEGVLTFLSEAFSAL